MTYKFTDEELKKFMAQIKGEKFLMDLQKDWQEKERNRLIQTAFTYIMSGIKKHPFNRALDHVIEAHDDFEKVRREWKDMKALADFYFELIFISLDALQNMNGKEDAGGT